mmetsp:Transcript_14961/g.16930  ORF Transcript_14961/g.16930 Transcript_14961/m.16930 type:complete len:392 (+) Transcript_14961:186-1361(+)|eukprot:CAMPEP_0184008442 /NCGR_PEP_ID=MMETSP0954-20121128/1976_1 /TAXON_ID=627963 /ORGANISM="Aplanochytrium sp, Strain PBS07" /LENGTH=391 /DNA_ID=CAMNT_0026287553 /DNA_START=131 /DNA_END=1306 /DNA_ORIENTATION=+
MIRQMSKTIGADGFGFDGTTGDLEPSVSAFFTYGAMFCSIGGVVVQYVGNQFLQGIFYPFAVYSVENLEVQNLFDLILLSTVFIGLTSVIVNFFLGIAALSRKTGCVKIFAVLAIIVSLCTFCLGGGIILFLNFLDQSAESPYEENAELSEQELSIQAYSLALFTGCCVPDLLTGTEGTDYYLVDPCNSENQPEDLDLGEACVFDPEKYDFFLRTATDDICDSLKDATIDLEGVTIPGSSIAVTQITGPDVESVKLVGPNSEFGCGAGFPVAFQYAFFVWFDQTIKPLAIVCLCIGLFQFLMLTLIAGQLFCGIGSNDEDDFYDDILDDDQAAFVNSRMLQHQQQQSSDFHYTNGDMSEHSTPTSVQPRPASVQLGSPQTKIGFAQIEDKI